LLKSLFYRIFLNSTSSAFCNGRIDFEPVLCELVVLEVIVAQDNQYDFPEYNQSSSMRKRFGQL